MEMLKLSGVAKTFQLHTQGGVSLPVMSGVNLTVSQGECLALTGASGVGKSTLMRMIYGNFKCAEGAILVRHGDEWLDLASAHPHAVLDARRRTIGYVSQFLRVLPRVATLDIVSEPARAQGVPDDAARAHAKDLLTRLRIPEALWSLSPITFSGGEQQRVNLARGFAARYPILLLDEPTASLDAENRQTVIEMIIEAREAGSALVGIFHDLEARKQITTHDLDLTVYAAA